MFGLTAGNLHQHSPGATAQPGNACDTQTVGSVWAAGEESVPLTLLEQLVEGVSHALTSLH